MFSPLDDQEESASASTIARLYQRRRYGSHVACALARRGCLVTHWRSASQAGEVKKYEEMATLNLKGDDFHPDWNYTITPREQNVER